jgi:hypothetical protein
MAEEQKGDHPLFRKEKEFEQKMDQ